MAKGRKLTISRSDRYLDSYSYGNSYGANGSGVTEFGEEDVWSMVDDAVERNLSSEDIDSSQSEWSPRSSTGGRSSGGARERMVIPRRDDSRHAGGLSLAFEDPTLASPRIVHQFHGSDGLTPQGGGRRSVNMSSSAPVNIPDWNKIYRVDSVESMHDSDEERDSEMVPPHVYLARSRKMLATSVFEGQGRTLKGRDMSRVRDAIWSRTGFDG